MTHPFRGRLGVVPDKSLTHRSVLLGAWAEGTTTIHGPNQGDDCRATLRAVQALGAEVDEQADSWIIRGGRSRLHEPTDVLDLGNSGTGMRLIAGFVAGIPGISILTGDASLRNRPMGRVLDPLSQMGVKCLSRAGGKAPLVVHGGEVTPIEYASPVPSGQIKSALLLAGLSLGSGTVRVVEPARSRDHTERLLQYLGADLRSEGCQAILRAPTEIRPFEWRIPGDVSAATFFMVGASIVPDSELVLENVGLNPTRSGAIDVLRRMGANIEWVEASDPGPEPVGDLTIRSSRLLATVVEGEEIPRLIDEIPVLSIAAAMAEGTTEFRGVSELRVKESDRVASTSAMLRAFGVDVEDGPDHLRIVGRGHLGSGTVATEGDHRIAMSALIASTVADGPITLDSTRMIATSDPTFLASLRAATGIDGAAR